MYRKQIKQIKKDLERKMVFIIGPRQVGKTWLAKEIVKDYNNSVYLNYDRFEDRQIIKKEQWLQNTKLLALDELHKMPNWKNYLKGVFDTKPDNLKILVTGSARLDTFRQTGDSLAGRFFIHHLLPFSLKEVNQVYTLDRLIEQGGFPEPLLQNEKTEVDRWRNQYIDGLVRTDVLDFEKIHDFKAIQLIFEMLRRKVGSPISFTSIARDVQISPSTVIKYVQILEALYIIFRVTPYSRNIARAILKEPKIYFFDNGLVVGNEGAKLENFVALSLLKSFLAENDNLGKKISLQYLRTRNGQEVDFAKINTDGQIDEIIEVKNTNNQLSKSLKYFSLKYDLPAVQVVKNLQQEKQISDNIRILKAENYLRDLYL